MSAAAAAKRGRDLREGEVGWVTLVDRKCVKRTVPCIVMEREETGRDRSVVACPATYILSEAGEWIIPKSEEQEAAQRVYQVDGVAVSFHRVVAEDLLVSEPKKISEGWSDADGRSCRAPQSRLVRKVYFGSDAEGTLTDTDAEGKKFAELMEQMEELKRENKSLRENREGGPKGAERERAAAPLQPRFFELDGDESASDLEGENFDSAEDDSDDEGLGAALKAFMAQGGLNLMGSQTEREAASSGEPRPGGSPPRARRPGGTKAGPGQSAGKGAAVAGERSLSPPRGARAAGAAAATRVRGPGIVGGDPNLMLQVMMFKLLKKMAAKSRDGGENGELDGLRVMRTLSRMRELKRQMRANPGRVIREFEASWPRSWAPRKSRGHGWMLPTRSTGASSVR